MKNLTVDDVMAMEPCSGYPRERVEALWAGRVALSARDVAELDIPVRDRVWVLVRMLSGRDARLWACDITEAALALHWPADDRRPHEAVRVARRFAVGEATLEQLGTARSAVEDAAWDDKGTGPSRGACWAAVWTVASADAAGRAAYGAAVAVGAAEQIESLIARIEESAE